MSADIIDLAKRRPVNPGNGAREAMIGVFMAVMNVRVPENAALDLSDGILLELWARGFKVVPLDGTE